MNKSYLTVGELKKAISLLPDNTLVYYADPIYRKAHGIKDTATEDLLDGNLPEIKNTLPENANQTIFILI